jgi:CrcB protein
MLRYSLLALGGAIGTICRYLISTYTYNFFRQAIFPWGSLAVNLCGSFIVGLLAGLNEPRTVDLRLFLYTGLLGGFTTFSAFSLETMNLVRTGELRYAIINVAVSNLLGVALAFAGFFISRYMTSAAYN